MAPIRLNTTERASERASPGLNSNYQYNGSALPTPSIESEWAEAGRPRAMLDSVDTGALKARHEVVVKQLNSRIRELDDQMKNLLQQGNASAKENASAHVSATVSLNSPSVPSERSSAV